MSGFRSHQSSSYSKIELFANALNCWASKPKTGKDVQNALQQIGKSVSLLAYNGNGNHQHQYCPETYSQIEWRNQLWELITKATKSENKIYPFNDLTWSKWASNLKIFLEKNWDSLRKPKNNWDSVKTKIKSPNGSAKKMVIDTIKKDQNSYSKKIRMTTFHDVKGETLDAVLVVSAKNKKSKGGHFSQWISENITEKEYVRFAYVASSRPKHLLIWAIPKGSSKLLLKKITALGFEVETPET